MLEEETVLDETKQNELKEKKMNEKLALEKQREQHRNEYIEQRHLSKKIQVKVKEKERKSIYVKGFPATWKNSDLKKRFEEFEPVQATSLLNKDGSSRSCGFIDFETNENAQNAVNEMNGRGIDGGELEVTIAKLSQKGKKQ